MAVQEPQQSQSTSSDVSRRRFLFAFGVALNAVAASLLAIPIIGYVFSSFRFKTLQEWIRLGPLDHFPEGQTRLATYRNPFTSPWDGSTADIPCWVRRLDPEKFQVFAINCTHLGCPVRCSRSRACLCAPVTVACTTRTARVLLALHHAAYLSTSTKSRMATCGCWGVSFRRSQAILRHRHRTRYAACCCPLVRPTFAPHQAVCINGRTFGAGQRP